MTDNQSPISAVFELQRTTIEQSQKLVEQSLDVPVQVNERVHGTIGPQKQAQQRTIQFGQQSIESVLDAVETSVPQSDGALDEVRDAVDEGFETLLEQHGDAVDTVDEQYGEGIERYEEFSVDVAEALNDQLEALLEANEEVETQTIEAFE